MVSRCRRRGSQMTKAGCKTRKKFIKMLRNALLWRYNSNEIQDIISDYDGFFAAGLEQGKTEAELCSEFGDPEDIAKSLDIELKAKRSFFRYSSNRMISGTAIATAIILILLYYSFRKPFHPSRIYIASVLVVLSGMAIWTAIGGRQYTLHGYAASKGTFRKELLLIPHCILVLITCSILALMRSIVRSNTVYPPFGLDISQTGPFIRDSLYFVLIISLCILFFGMYRCRRCSTLYYSLVLHGIGSAVSILTLLNALKWIHDISQYVKLVNLSMLPWIMSVICSAVFVFNIRTGGRKKSTADGRENHGCSDEKRNP